MDGDAESFCSVRHRRLVGLDIFGIIQWIESTIVVETAENMKSICYGSINGTIFRRVLLETGHDDSFTHLQVVILAIDNLVEVTTVVVEGDIFEAGISPDRQTF